MAEVYYNQIVSVIKFLNTLSCKVEVDFTLPTNEIGQCRYRENLIKLNCFDPREVLFTLIHEGGHWLSYLRYSVEQRRPEPESLIKEDYAYLYGWYIIRKLKLPISKEEWRHEEGRNLLKVD